MSDAMEMASIRDAPTSAPEPPAIVLQGLHVRYGAIDVVKGIDLIVGAGEIVSLLGQSGCGKTTTLRCIAGFVSADQGSVIVHGRDVTDTPPNRRNVGFVFQGYALFPHLSVFENVAYGLRRRKVRGPEIAERVRRVLSLVQLSHLADRRPKQISGGQQQRVAIARALVIEPSVLLLDEPLSNLDAKLRHEMRVELRRLLKEQSVASIFVTHDQEEAIVLSDRIALMNEGRIEQIGTPQMMYHKPGSLFAAAFLGQANFLKGVVKSVSGGIATLTIGSRDFSGIACRDLAPGAPAVMVVKHERVRLMEEATADNSAVGSFDAASFLGPTLQLHCAFCGQHVTGLLPASADVAVPLSPNAPVRFAWDERDALIFPDAEIAPSMASTEVP